MGGLFGTISRQDCVNDLYYDTDYNSHLGTRRGGMAVYDGKTFPPGRICDCDGKQDYQPPGT